jgi:thiosulfate dehydrogenase
MSDPRPSAGHLTTIVASILAGAALVVGTLVVGRGSAADSAAITPAPTAEYGRELVEATALHLGPSQPDPDRRYTGTHMACASCHLATGTQPGTLTLLEAAASYPDFSNREGSDRDLKDRINGCMQRSMNGRPLPRDGVEMRAIEAYIADLGAQYAAMGQTRRTPDEQPRFAEPDRRADLDAGRRVFEDRCAVCHGTEGAGLRRSGDPSDGYTFPPLWGPDSFNNGAGMHRVLTAARFIKARMPFGQADLTDDEAFDVAAYINSHPRPEMANLERDYPDRLTKPVDTSYPPFADPFTQDQHRFGPFRPIREYRARTNEGSGSGG